MLGERESGTARLEEAMEAYRAALQETRRELVPLDWAMTQNNLGNALRVLGEHDRDTARLVEAIDVLRSALDEFTPENAPAWHDMAQYNLAKAEAALKRLVETSEN